MPSVLSMREETAEERRIREWFATQALESPKNLEEAARLVIGLVTGLIGVLFSVLTISADKLPGYLSLPGVRALGVAAVVLWLLSLLFGLLVVVPFQWQINPSKPASEKATFEQLLAHKSRWLTASVICFWVGVTALGIILALALLASPNPVT